MQNRLHENGRKRQWTPHFEPARSLIGGQERSQASDAFPIRRRFCC